MDSHFIGLGLLRTVFGIVIACREGPAPEFCCIAGATQPKSKIGHWKKMKYTKLMIPTGLIAIDLALICSRHNLECARHPPDSSQTPSRHPSDTPIYATFWPIRGNREKRKKLMKMSLIRCLSIACISYPPRQYPESPRQPSDTSQTPSRHPSDTPKYRNFDRSKATRRKWTS